ncbi:GFA family protein [Neorhizobium alkalisoli]|uniref:CENP-V/GFA domain-containing protein n=1 Tax=Neorhizobium alkalisoli TaxID=528178 RepID=A0A561R2K5_9HYPH|nr:GFA family protein [Neorhizobium alkalisoli]TWF56850.1 hypothetical protein FHW37_102489 [Neorhizobium alkalisoli]
MTELLRSGGCQCGAVRFRTRGQLGRASICHCRMCQKAFGGFFGPLVSAPNEGPEAGIEWTRGEPKYYQSSVNIDRGFCGECGTPLTYRHPQGLELSIGAFDNRDDLVPKIQVNFDSHIPWVTEIFDAPKRASADDVVTQEMIISFQHPDHDTEIWPEKGLHL